MSEQAQRLHLLLEQLHAELEAAEDLDAGTEQELRGAMREIRAALRERTGGDAPPESAKGKETADHHATMSDAARQFSASHPLLARTIGQLADILGQSGI